MMQQKILLLCTAAALVPCTAWQITCAVLFIMDKWQYASKWDEITPRPSEIVFRSTFRWPMAVMYILTATAPVFVLLAVLRIRRWPAIVAAVLLILAWITVLTDSTLGALTYRQADEFALVEAPGQSGKRFVLWDNAWWREVLNALDVIISIFAIVICFRYNPLKDLALPNNYAPVPYYQEQLFGQAAPAPVQKSQMDYWG